MLNLFMVRHMHYSFFTSFTHQVFNRSAEQITQMRPALVKQVKSLLLAEFYAQPFETQIDTLTKKLSDVFIQVCGERETCLPPPGDYNSRYVEELLAVINGAGELSLRGCVSRVYLHCIERRVSCYETAVCIVQAGISFADQHSNMMSASELSFSVFLRCKKREEDTVDTRAWALSNKIK